MWTGGGLPVDALQAWKEEYERNIEGNGAEGGPGYYPGEDQGREGDAGDANGGSGGANGASGAG